ncbi:hypothetical protein VU04_10220 [Desulfobulbus sp. TB]|nr:hypothetical protein [Desulfobulbus sp. TB]
MHHVEGQLLEEIRTNTHKGMVFGNDRFKEELAALTGRRLKPKKRGWPTGVAKREMTRNYSATGCGLVCGLNHYML